MSKIFTNHSVLISFFIVNWLDTSKAARLLFPKKKRFSTIIARFCTSFLRTVRILLKRTNRKNTRNQLSKLASLNGGQTGRENLARFSGHFQ